jgi:hypothetical protein
LTDSSNTLQTKLTDFAISLASVDLAKLLEPFRSGFELPLGFYEDRCLRCGSQLNRFGSRHNKNSVKKKWFCPKCEKVTTPGFDRGAHVPSWVYDRILYSMAKSYRNVDIQLEVKKASEKYGPPDYISLPTIYRIGASFLDLMYRFEPRALRCLTTKPPTGVWCMDDRFQDLPFDQSLFPDKTLNPRKGNPHAYPTVVIHEESGYTFSACVSRKRDKLVAVRSLALALDRAGVEPDVLKIDQAKGLYAAARTLLPSDKILCVNKKDNFAFNNRMERCWSDYGLRHNKHECQYKRPWTQELSINVYRYYRGYIWPYDKTGKTPAETLGIALPRNINNEISFLPLLDFAYHFNSFVESELSGAKVRFL